MDRYTRNSKCRTMWEGVLSLCRWQFLLVAPISEDALHCYDGQHKRENHSVDDVKGPKYTRALNSCSYLLRIFEIVRVAARERLLVETLEMREQ